MKSTSSMRGRCLISSSSAGFILAKNPPRNLEVLGSGGMLEPSEPLSNEKELGSTREARGEGMEACAGEIWIDDEGEGWGSVAFRKNNLLLSYTSEHVFFFESLVLPLTHLKK